MTYLSPGIPGAFFEAIVEHVRRALGWRTSLSVEPRVSGPMRVDVDPFSKGETDVGFLCSPSFFCLRDLERSPVELLPVAPVFGNSRTPGQPVYFSEVVVRRESPASAFLDLRGSSWIYNDPCCLSGYYNFLKKLTEMDDDEHLFPPAVLLRITTGIGGDDLPRRGGRSGHRLERSKVGLESFPEMEAQLRVVESWGPFPIQPMVIRSDLQPELKERLRAVLLAIDANLHASPPSPGSS